MRVFLLLIFFASLNSFSNPRVLYYQKILGVLNRQFSQGVLSFDTSFRKKAKLIRSKHGRKSIKFKKLVDYYDEIKKKLYFQQNDATQIIRDFLKVYDSESLKNIHLSLSSFDKIFYPEDHIKGFKDILKKQRRVPFNDESLSGRLKQYYEISDILNRLGFRSEKKVNFALNLIVEKSKVQDMNKLEIVLKSMLFKSFFKKYKPFVINLEKRIELYIKNMP